MTITVSLLSIIILLFIINNIIEHLFNWGFRTTFKYDYSRGGTVLLLFFYAIKTLILFLILLSYLS